jgi:glutathione synthase/RimK-type ligase-like ATP-grasp enzyme
MKAVLAVLTPDPADESYAARWRPGYERLAALLEEAGAEVIGSPWVDPTPDQAAAALPLFAWGYHKQQARWLARLADTRTPMINPAPALIWNTDKRYLLELQDKGAPVLPTLAVEYADWDTVEAAFGHFGAEALVVKPRVSAASHETVVVERFRPFTPPNGPALIQPFLPNVKTEGELSLFYIGGAFSHAARKVAKGGDFRVQPQFGGAFSIYKPEREAFACAEAVLDAAPVGLTYARVDMIRAFDGRLALMELECIEPDLYLDLTPEVGPSVARALIDAARR